MMRPHLPRRANAPWSLIIFLIVLLALLPVAGGCRPNTPPEPGTGGTVVTPPGPPGGEPPAPTPVLAATLRVHFLNVGQGDAILIQSSPGGTALIDGGPRSAGPAVVAYLREQGVEHLDLLIATHAHEDHIGGLINVLRAFPARRIIDAGVAHTSKTYGDFLTEIESQVLSGGCVFETPEGQTVNLADNVTVTVLGPSQAMNSLNNSSVVCRLDFGLTSFMFTGDAEEPAERALLMAGVLLAADVLKVGHHGSSTSTSPDFLAAVGPVHAVISVGAGNTYGHPSSITLGRLQAAGATIHRTDMLGHIVFEGDGQSLQIVAAQGSIVAVQWDGFYPWRDIVW
jgi:competence protein ComEC